MAMQGKPLALALPGNTVQIWETKDAASTMRGEQVITVSKPLYLKMKVQNGYQCRFYWSEGGRDWNEMSTGNEPYNSDFLPPWDRSPRPGLAAQGRRFGARHL